MLAVGLGLHSIHCAKPHHVRVDQAVDSRARRASAPTYSGNAYYMRSKDDDQAELGPWCEAEERQDTVREERRVGGRGGRGG